MVGKPFSFFDFHLQKQSPSHKTNGGKNNGVTTPLRPRGVTRIIPTIFHYTASTGGWG